MRTVRISSHVFLGSADRPNTIGSYTFLKSDELMPTNLAESIRNSLHVVVSRHHNFGEFGPITETTLIRNGAFCGRRFSLGGFSLVWFQEEGQIKLYSPSGALESSCSVFQFCSENSVYEGTSVRRAA